MTQTGWAIRDYPNAIWCPECGPHYDRTNHAYSPLAAVCGDPACKVRALIEEGGKPDFISAGAIVTACIPLFIAP